MTPEEAIKTIELAKAEVEWEYPMDYAVAFEKAKEALEKQIPKDVLEEAVAWFDLCPECHKAISRRYEDGIHYIDYCPFCGQALEWGDET